MLTQARRFGTPIIRALIRFADEIRQKRRQRAEVKAAKTKIKILFLFVLFIFPCVFVVLSWLRNTKCCEEPASVSKLVELLLLDVVEVRLSCTSWVRAAGGERDRKGKEGKK